MIPDYADCYPEDVNMLANLEHDLLMSKHDRFGFQWDLQEVFQFDITEGRTWSRDLQSGKEASDFVASILEEEGRLVYTF
ncbi:hypothetical protein HK099_004997 [Clydaea vesicula]|uniref:Uncharacterized protein n=1 Tax=Clydaea vesicula TaxID=447962 RepID=A0AAD5U4C9_9FUNG|nr:hypothetical protein HK099_004997 [Clydaea vesicula]